MRKVSINTDGRIADTTFNDSKLELMCEEPNSQQLVYVKELFGILEAGGEKQLDLHLACMPNLNKQECILFLGLACVFDNQTLKNKILSVLPITKQLFPDKLITKGQLQKDGFNSLCKTIYKSTLKDSNFDLFTSFLRKRVIGHSFIIAVNQQLKSIYAHILLTPEQLLINRKYLVDLARKRELKLLKSLLGHISTAILEEKSKVSEIFGRLYGRSEGTPLNQLSLFGILSDKESDYTDQELLEILTTNMNVQINEALICEFIKQRRFEFIDLLGEEGVKVISQRALKCAINLEEWPFVLKHIKSYIDNQLLSEGKQSTSLGETLCDSLTSSYMNIEPKLYVCHKCVDYLTYETSEHIIEIFLESIDQLTSPSSPDNLGYSNNATNIIKNGFFIHSYNPMKICILIIELARTIANKYKNTRKIADKLENILLNLSLKLQMQIVDDVEYRNIILDKDLKGREIITIIQQLKLLPLLNNPETQKVIKTFWDSHYKLSGSFLDISTNYHLLFKYPLHSKIDMEQKLRFKYSGRKFHSHWGQFHVWKESTFLRYFVSTAFLVLICSLTQLQLMNMNETIKYHTNKGGKALFLRLQTIAQVQEEMKTNPQLLAEYNKLEYVQGDFPSEKRFLDFLFDYNPALKVSSKDFTDNLYKAVDDIKSFTYLTISFFIFLIQFILERIFSILENRHIRIIRPDIILIIIILGISIYLYDAYYRLYDWCSPRYYQQFYAFSLDFCFLFKYSNQEGGYLEYQVAIMACLWIAVLFTLTMSRTFGPLIFIFIAMMKDVAVFIIIFMLQLMVFACIGNILFINLEGRYDTFGYCLLTLYQASLGEFNYEEFDIFLETRRIIGKVYLTIYLLLSAILAINLLIAILSTTYAILWEQSAPLFYIENIQQRPLYKYSKRYGSLVSSFFPYYIFIPFVAPLLFMKNKIQINMLILHFEFIPIFLILYILFLSISLLLLPFCYLKTILHKIHLINREDKPRKYGVMYLVIYIVFGLLIATIQTIFIDTVIFTRNIYENNLPLLYREKRRQIIPPDRMNTFMLFLADFQISKKEPERRHIGIGIHQFRKKLRENCGMKTELGKDYSYILQLMNFQSKEANEINTLSLSQIFLFERFAKRNMVGTTIYPHLLLGIISNCRQFKVLKNITISKKNNNIQQIYDSLEAEIIDTKRITQVLFYLKISKILQILRKGYKLDATNTIGRNFNIRRLVNKGTNPKIQFNII